MEPNFREIYNSIPSVTRANDRPEVSPKLEFIRRIASVTMRSENTVRQWICGTRTPEKLVKKIISKELNKPVEVLFPE